MTEVFIKCSWFKRRSRPRLRIGAGWACGIEIGDQRIEFVNALSKCTLKRIA
jgi:hypothetical protein